MNLRTKRVLEEALELPAEDRATLVAALEGSLDGDAERSSEQVEAEWAEELKTRLADVVAGRVNTRDADEVLAELRRSIGNGARVREQEVRVLDCELRQPPRTVTRF